MSGHKLNPTLPTASAPMMSGLLNMRRSWRRFFRGFIPRKVDTRTQVLLWLCAIFLTCLLIANLIGGLLFAFELPFANPLGSSSGAWQVLLTAGIIPFPVTFLLTDLLNEFYGQRTAKFVTLIGFVMSVIVYGFLIVAQALPEYANSPLSKADYIHFSNLYTQMFTASLLAYMAGQLLDISLFQWFKKRTGNRLLWLRAQGSTVVSQLFDSFIVVFVAFWGSLSVPEMWLIGLNNYLWKFLIVVLITPLLYLGHRVLEQVLPRASHSVSTSRYKPSAEKGLL